MYTNLCMAMSHHSRAQETHTKLSSCLPSAVERPSTSWSLGGRSLASLWTYKNGSAIICVYDDDGDAIAYTKVALRNNEFVASQTCSYQGKWSRSIFGIGIRGRKDDIALRLAWTWKEDAGRLEAIDPSLVKCIYSELDE